MVFFTEGMGQHQGSLNGEVFSIDYRWPIAVTSAMQAFDSKDQCSLSFAAVMAPLTGWSADRGTTGPPTSALSVNTPVCPCVG